jgi:hypothetical protein
MMKMNFGLLLILSFFIAACSGPGAEKGFAPGTVVNPSPVPSPESTTTSNVKYGQRVVTANNWEVVTDSSDPVEHKQLSNGWTVEVKYE